MSDAAFLHLDHDEALALLAFLRLREDTLDDVLQTVLLKAERRLFAVHSIEEMEKLIGEATRNGIGR